MIKHQKMKSGKVKLTFSLPLDACAEDASVIGYFNDWDPLATPLKKRSNGTRSASVEVDEGQVVEFKYLRDGGDWFCDTDVYINDNGNNAVVA